MKNELIIWERFSFYLCCFLSILIPIPLFLDGLSGGFVLQQDSFPQITKFPIPVGLLTFSLMFLIFFINAIIFREKYQFLVENRVNRFVLYVLSFFLLFWATVIANNSFLRVIQLVLPFFLILLVAFPTDFYRIKKITYFYLFSFFIFNLTHLLYLYLNHNIFNVREWDYGLYWGYGIYQAFVSYPGVLAIFFALVSFLSFIEKNLILKFYFILFCFVLIISLGLAARRISFFEMLIPIFLLSSFMFFSIISKKWIINKNYFLSFISFFLLILFVLSFYFKMPIYTRASTSVENNTFDSGRIEIYSNAIDFLTADYYYLIFGYSGNSGFHNYFLDIIFSMGLFPFLLSIFIFIFFFKKNVSFSFFNIYFYLMLSILGCFLLQSLLNASITQPLYLCNFMMVLLISIFYVKPKVWNT